MFDGFLNAGSNIFLLLGALVVGFAIIIYGGDKFVDSAVWMAVKTKMPKMLIGATVVSIGTTLPEMFASFTAAAGGSSSIAIGNALGSIMCNTAMILAVALIAAPCVVNRKQFMPKYLMLAVAMVAVLVFALSGTIDLWQCLVLVAFGVFYFVYNIVGALKQNKLSLTNGEVEETDAEEEAHYNSKNSVVMILLFLVGAIAIAVGANLLVSSVKGICGQMGVSEAVIALTVVSVGTSLPELVTAITSLRKNNTEISLGNIIGANVINITLIVGGSGLFTGGMSLADDFATTLVTIVGIIAVLLIIGLPIFIKRKTYRWQGIATTLVYIGYVAYLISKL